MDLPNTKRSNARSRKFAIGRAWLATSNAQWKEFDTARWPEVIGTISGDDTIFIATLGLREQQKLGERLHDIFGL